MSDVLVIDYKRPLQRLMAWFLSDGGVPNIRVDSREDLKDVASTQHPRVVVVNSTAPLSEIEDIITEVHKYDGSPKAIVLHPAPLPDDPPTGADLLLHDVSDPDSLIRAVKSMLEGGTPSQASP